MSAPGIVRNESWLRDRAGGDGNHYEAISVGGFHEVVTAACVDPETTTFLDLGAGRGRALLLAARLGFHSVIGVELNPALAAAAERNLHVRQAKRKTEALSSDRFQVWVRDAAEIDLPDGPVLLFLYNSLGPATLRRVIDLATRARAERPRRIDLCCFNPIHTDVLEQCDNVKVTAANSYWTVYAFTD